MQLYAITSRTLLPGTDSQRRAALIELARAWATHAVDYIQIREKDLTPNELRILTEQIVNAVRQQSSRTRILLNGPAQIAFDTGADGVHFPGNAPAHASVEARNLFAHSGREAILSYACHSVTEILKAKEESQRNPHASTTNTLILYAPVFEKQISAEYAGVSIPGQGLENLKHAVEAAKPIPVFALGGVTPQNAPACLVAGAAGVAAIRAFIADDWQRLKATPT
jgi:thiamine-phosphate pyrophosphorylase